MTGIIGPRRLTVSSSVAGTRLDSFAASAFSRSRNQIQALIRAQKVLVNDRLEPSSYVVRADDQIKLLEPPAGPLTASTAPELPVIYEDTDVMVVDKPAGLIVHPAATVAEPTVADFARQHSSDPDAGRPGIVHRLDRDTSGLLIIAKTAAAKTALQNEFRRHTVTKTYLALVVGAPKPPAAQINLPLDRDPKRPLRRRVATAGRTAITNYRTLAAYPGFSLVEAQPQTGRTHQLRVHFAAIGHPIVGDTTYGPPKRQLGLTRHFLHAARLEFTSPSGRVIKVESSLPADLATILHTLEKADPSHV